MRLVRLEVLQVAADTIKLHYDVPSDDFTRAGEASSDLKGKLKKMGIDPGAIRKVAIALYEAEINMVIHANGGYIDVEISENGITICLQDVGPGIKDIVKAMQVGYSTALEQIRTLGFGAGMGLPNMQNYTDELIIDSIVGVGTKITMFISFT